MEKGHQKPKKHLTKRQFLGIIDLGLRKGGKPGEKVKPEGCFIMEPPETRAAGQKDEKEKGCLRVELKNKQRHPAGRAGMKSCKHKKSISCC